MCAWLCGSMSGNEVLSTHLMRIPFRFAFKVLYTMPTPYR